MTFSISSSSSIARMIGASLMASGRVPNMVMTRSATAEQPCSAAIRAARPARREGLLLGVAGEDLHERIGLELRELASAPAPRGGILQRLRVTESEGREPSLLRSLVHRVLEQACRLL